MHMQLIAGAILLHLFAAPFALVAGRRAAWFGPLSAALASAAGLSGALVGLFAPAAARSATTSVPGVTLELGVDPLTAWFLIPLFLLALVGAPYGAVYLRGGNRLGAHWAAWHALVASMALVFTARHGLVFLVAWEAMTVASFFLVARDSERHSVRRAAWLYLVASHLGAAALLLMFAWIGGVTGSLSFTAIAAARHALAPLAGILLGLGLLGFGMKAGLAPLHVWLPEAHPAAPSHVSALMSGAMITTGFYGILRLLALLGAPHPAWAWVLITIGLATGIGGALLALSQNDLKRILAYSTVENAGLLALGLGLGLLGWTHGLPRLAMAGFAAMLLHVVNHALAKGLLFLVAGSVGHATHSLDIERMGGLLRRMPRSGGAFLVGSIALVALPPLNGFAGEFLLFLAGFEGARAIQLAVSGPAIAAIAGLALIGGLALAALARAFGIAFLGEPRSAAADAAHEAPAMLTATPWALVILCGAMTLAAPLLLPRLAPVIEVFAPVSPVALAGLMPPLARIALLSLAVAGLTTLLALLRHRLLARRVVRQGPTWGCGYARPTARMQYTGASLAEPATGFFLGRLQRRRLPGRLPLFPVSAAASTDTPDPACQHLFRPVFRTIEHSLAALRPLQAGNLHLYILYIALTLVALLVWKFW